MYPTRWTVLETRKAWVLLRSGPMIFTVPRSVLPAGVRSGETLVTSGEPVGCRYPVWHRAGDADDPAADAPGVTMPRRRRLWNEDEGEGPPSGSRWRKNRGTGRRP